MKHLLDILRSYAHLKDQDSYVLLPSKTNPEVERWQKPYQRMGDTRFYDLEQLKKTSKKEVGVSGGGIYHHPEEEHPLYVKYVEALKKNMEPKTSAHILQGAKQAHAEVLTTQLAHHLDIPAYDVHYLHHGGRIKGVVSPALQDVSEPNFQQTPRADIRSMDFATHGDLYRMSQVQPSTSPYQWGQHFGLSLLTHDEDRHMHNLLVHPERGLIGIDYARANPAHLVFPEGTIASTLGKRKIGGAHSSLTTPLDPRVAQKYMETGLKQLQKAPRGYDEAYHGAMETMDNYLRMDPKGLLHPFGGENPGWIDLDQFARHQQAVEEAMRNV